MNVVFKNTINNSIDQVYCDKEILPLKEDNISKYISTHAVDRVIKESEKNFIITGSIENNYKSSLKSFIAGSIVLKRMPDLVDESKSEEIFSFISEIHTNCQQINVDEFKLSSFFRDIIFAHIIHNNIKDQERIKGEILKLPVFQAYCNFKEMKSDFELDDMVSEISEMIVWYERFLTVLANNEGFLQYFFRGDKTSIPTEDPHVENPSGEKILF